jgi:NhaP-type Na+/H+ or K+/H+ antiporter
MSPYTIIIAAAVIIILSFIFNIIAKKTNVPSVLMLILLGIIIQQFFWQPDIESKDSTLMLGLEVLGNIGLIFIVLEAALDLKLQRDKLGMIVKSFLIALLALLISAAGIAALFMMIWHSPESSNNVNWFTSFIYATPLSIMSSAIIIPSVAHLVNKKKEFLIYESTFSDIIGIMFFYFLKDNGNATSSIEVVKGVSFNIGITVLIAIIASYLLVMLFQKLKMQAKYFLTFAVLLLLYAVGKSFHLSSLLIILFFGLVLNNTNIFFLGPLKNFSVKGALKDSLHELHVITLETAFVLRTFFFVVFGITITVSSLLDFTYGLISIAIVAILFAVRFILLRVLSGKDITPELWIAPRGLITVLLFFAIPNGMIDGHGDILESYNSAHDYTIPVFDQGILLYTILITSIIMTVAMILNSGGKVKDLVMDSITLKKTENILSDKIEDAVSSKDSEQENK